MKSILLKIDQELFEELEESVKYSKVSKTAFIKSAITEAIKSVKRKNLAKQLKKEISEINKRNLDTELISELETASLSDLKGKLNEG